MDIMTFIDALEAHVSGHRRREIMEMSPGGLQWWFAQLRGIIKRDKSEAVQRLEKIAQQLQRAEELHRELREVFDEHLMPELCAMSRVIEEAAAAHDARKAALMMGNVPPAARRSRAAATSRKLSRALIIEAVCAHCGVERVHLEGPSRHKQHAYARMVAAFLMYHLLPMSLPQIGEALGGRDHSTISYGLRKVCSTPALRKMAIEVAATIGADDVIEKAVKSNEEAA